MGSKSIVWEYVRVCATGKPVVPSCDPVWQFGAISTFLVLAVLTLLILVWTRLQAESSLASH